MTVWERWVRQPQNVWLRKALYQVHLWTGIGVGLYVLVISVTGSVLVYRNELYMAATRKPFVATGSGPRLTDDQLKEAAVRAHPGYGVTNIARARNLNQAVDVSLKRGTDVKKRLFDRVWISLGSRAPGYLLPVGAGEVRPESRETIASMHGA